jgi:uncharacterized protein
MMEKKEPRLHDSKGGAALAIRVTPRASKNEIVEVQSDGTVRIRLVAPPVEGKANEALVAYLAEVLGVSKSRIQVVAGASGRDKLVTIDDLDARSVHEKILARLS